MGLKRIRAIMEMTYPADDPRTIEQLIADNPQDIRDGLSGGESGTLASYQSMGGAIDPDPEPTLPDAPPGPEGVRTA